MFVCTSLLTVAARAGLLNPSQTLLLICSEAWRAFSSEARGATLIPGPSSPPHSLCHSHAHLLSVPQGASGPRPRTGCSQSGIVFSQIGLVPSHPSSFAPVISGRPPHPPHPKSQILPASGPRHSMYSALFVQWLSSPTYAISVFATFSF